MIEEVTFRLDRVTIIARPEENRVIVIARGGGKATLELTFVEMMGVLERLAAEKKGT